MSDEVQITLIVQVCGLIIALATLLMTRRIKRNVDVVHTTFNEYLKLTAKAAVKDAAKTKRKP